MFVGEEHVYHAIDKNGWGDGPWQGEPDKAQFTDPATGLPCLAVRHPSSGHWCGYVGVAPGHPLHGVGYNICPHDPPCESSWCDHTPDTTLEAHGGLTYSAACDEGDEATSICHIAAPGQPDHVWWFGFDCAHSGDYAPGHAAILRGYGIGSLREALALPGEEYRDLAYIRAECARLAAQLARLAPAWPFPDEIR